MADPLLTSLCGICHMREPKYKCPKCGAKTCSLPCVKKHKTWSSCSGERDPTVFIPAAKLRTDAGIDHDYNFLTKIERKVEQVEKVFTEERGILPQRNQGPPPNKRARLQKGQGRGATTFKDTLRPWARMALPRLRKLEINIMYQPQGMSRERENKTSYSSRTKKINWQVEWLILDDPKGDENRPTRFLGKTMETTPLYIGFAECQEYQRRYHLSQEEKDKEKKEVKARRRIEQQEVRNCQNQDGHQVAQHPGSSEWREAPKIAQHPATSCWNSAAPERKQEHREHASSADRDKYKFFFGVANIPSREAPKLIPVDPTETLESILAGAVVVEFPTIYALPTGLELPEGYAVEKRRQKQSTQQPDKNPKKRKAQGLVAHESDEDGEVREDGEGGDEDQDGSDAGFEFDDNGKRAEFLEAAEEGRIDDDTTSSSGSDTTDGDSDMEVD
ncbi:hypothetical protein JX265_010981 [Neoarthrinium moseri]|uniref:Box C/D snoRNA protein 1 n=1 Tax=Neoarthrinium moseri TaxID=1658444 RepID=A0A9P9WDG4_9PEZI|nr:hypothetical protein JX266_003209 [Neoarthrinium moseri]KAI1857951.1 hypothetical protein JX265_010981 [Neoarthrinium moseri]